ncbi:MAG: beta-phosphoglucomutase [Lachnospiraceae bacterium]|nr:beta-phosphoglucomutase [Lachnospiraceae bacterium]
MKGVIFDLDGVLVSTDELHYQAWKQLADELGIVNFTKEDNEKQRGVSRMESLEIVLSKGNTVYSEKEKEMLAEKKNNYYKELLQELTDSAVLSGVKETLKFLKEKGILIGVGSVSKNTPVILEKTGLLEWIDQVSCGLDITKSKPDPEVFLVAAQKLELPCSECLVVEDSAAGITAAKAAGMKSLGVGPFYQELGATYAARGLNDVHNWDELLA